MHLYLELKIGTYVELATLLPIYTFLTYKVKAPAGRQVLLHD
ncbi:hypothetical protein [Scopulibacillus cellulosilyticus]|uniref:Uncharacterized protein n=1 Tax=Scopulibacillus cellulosilyticus TaxID=2665665 RepID=A0ABW2Q1G3_9BACL